MEQDQKQKDQDSILIVDDENTVRSFLSRSLSEEGYQCAEACDAGDALNKLSQGNYNLVLLDITMPGESGVDLLQEIFGLYPDIMVIMITATIELETVVECLKLGAYDYLPKPVKRFDLHQSVKRALEKQKLLQELHAYQQYLEDKVVEQSGRIRASIINTIRSLVYALEAKDEYTSGHSQRVSDIAAAIARELHLPQEDIDKIVMAALVHDIGKIGVKESILQKQGRLSEDEIAQIQKHPEIGERIMSPVADDEEILQYIRNHHCYFDGTGYPDKLKGYQIPLGARILAVADSYEAMTSERSYRKAMSSAEACAELIRCKKSQFDPEVVDAFIRCKSNV